MRCEIVRNYTSDSPDCFDIFRCRFFQTHSPHRCIYDFSMQNSHVPRSSSISQILCSQSLESLTSSPAPLYPRPVSQSLRQVSVPRYTRLAAPASPAQTITSTFTKPSTLPFPRSSSFSRSLPHLTPSLPLRKVASLNLPCHSSKRSHHFSIYRNET